MKQQPLPPANLTRRRDAARHLLRPARVRESLALAPQPFMRNSALAGVQAALTGAIALPLVYLSPWSHLVGYASLGTLVALFGRFAHGTGRNRIVLACGFWQTFAVLSMSSVIWLGAPFAVQLVLLAVLCGLFAVVSVQGKFGPPGPLIFIFAAGASMGEVHSWQLVLERGAATAGAAALAWLVCVLTEFIRQQARGGVSFPADPERTLRQHLVIAVRIGSGALVAACAAKAVGAHFPAWAAMGAVAVMQGVHLHTNMHRALQRMLGTVLGAGLVWLILSCHPSIWVLIVLIAIFQVVTEIVIGSNYALGQILVTPMALLMTYLASHGEAASAQLVPERVLDTLVGAVVGMLLAVVYSTLEDRVSLARYLIAKQRG